MFGRRKGTTKITIETHEITTVRLRHDGTSLRYCPICRQEVSGLSWAQSAEVLRADEAVLDELFASNQLHEVGDAVICGNSLVKYFE
jgi:hypothetical protein